MAVGIATFGPGTTSGIPISGTLGGGSLNLGVSGGYQNTAPTSTQYQGGNFAPTPSPQVLGDNTSAGSYGSTAAAPANGTGAGNVADIAAYQDQINSLNQLLGNEDNIAASGTRSINTGFDNSINQLTGQLQSNQTKLGHQRDDTTTNYGRNIDQINNNARAGYNSLMALLGGSGSAADILAPLAVSQQANSQRGASANAFAQNQKAIDDAVAAAQQNYNNQRKTVEGQKNDQLSKLLSSIDQQKIAYQQQLAAAQNQLNIAQGGNYQTPTANNNAISALIADQNNLANQYAQPSFSVQDYVAPDAQLAGYQANAAQLSGLNNQPDTSTDDTTSALAALLKQNQNTNAYNI